MGNPLLTWEKANKFSTGIDAGLFANHLTFSFDYFNDKYYDLLQVRGNGSSILGATNMRTNIGSNRYSGFIEIWQRLFLITNRIKSVVDQI